MFYKILNPDGFLLDGSLDLSSDGSPDLFLDLYLDLSSHGSTDTSSDWFLNMSSDGF